MPLSCRENSSSPSASAPAHLASSPLRSPRRRRRQRRRPSTAREGTARCCRRELLELMWRDLDTVDYLELMAPAAEPRRQDYNLAKKRGLASYKLVTDLKALLQAQPDMFLHHPGH